MKQSVGFLFVLTTAVYTIKIVLFLFVVEVTLEFVDRLWTKKLSECPIGSME